MEMKVTGKVIITFDLRYSEDVILDFQGELNGKSYVYNKLKRRPLAVTQQNEHIILPMKQMKPGKNKVEFSFTCLDKALNRNEDYMYTLFVPDMARTVFPCFEQPDLRAVFATTLKTPEGWKTMTSDNSCQLPTYLYSFVAGKFEEKAVVRDGRVMRALYRETDPAKVAQLDKVFDEAAQSLKWMEGYTGIACPFKEYGLVLLPNYQFGGMEHPGAIQLSDRRIFPAINVGLSGTRKEELIVSPPELNLARNLRKMLADSPTPLDSMDNIIKHMKKFNSNLDLMMQKFNS